MKKLIPTIVILLLTGPVFSQSDCDEFRTGRFQNVENGVVKSTIERNDSIQTEQYGEKIVNPATARLHHVAT